MKYLRYRSFNFLSKNFSLSDEVMGSLRSWSVMDRVEEYRSRAEERMWDRDKRFLVMRAWRQGV